VAWRARAINTRYTLVPAALAVGLVILAVVVADLGTAVVLAATAGAVFIVAGLDCRYFAIAAACGVVGVVFFVASKPYRVARIVGYIDPEFKIIGKFDPDDHLRRYLSRSLVARDTSYQAGQSKIAVGAGGITGQGLMQGKQKLMYLPEAHTDFIYAVVSEELGMFGSMGLLAGFLLSFWRGLRASMLAPDDFGRYLALGITTCIAVQAFMASAITTCFSDSVSMRAGGRPAGTLALTRRRERAGCRSSRRRASATIAPTSARSPGPARVESRR
jgi:cell division protein FtsW